MLFNRRPLIPLADRGPLRVMFVITSMPVGGAETLLVNLVRGMDRDRFQPELCCLKQLGPLGEELADEIPTHHGLLRGKYDVRVLARLAKLFRDRRIDAVVTVGAGDKMFWGRWAAHRAGVPVIASALHSTGWPDVIGRLNRLPALTRWTDAFIGVARAHGDYLENVEGFPAAKVRVIPNGVDINRFHPVNDPSQVRGELGLEADDRVIGIVAALRPEKNHALLLRAASQVCRQVPRAKFLVVGDGPERAALERQTTELGLRDAVRFLGARSDIAELLTAMDVFVLTSRMEANPVSILEAMATGLPVIAPRVGSIPDSVCDGQTGFLTEQGDEAQVVERLIRLCDDPALARRMGSAGRAAAAGRWSLDVMVTGYEQLLAEIYTRKSAAQQRQRLAPAVNAGPAPVATRG